MIIVNLLSALFLFLLGLMMRKFKLTCLVAGYNTSPKKERDKYDKNKLTAIIGNILMFSALLLCLPLFLTLVYPDYLKIVFRVSWVLFIIFIMFFVVYINVNSKILKK